MSAQKTVTGFAWVLSGHGVNYLFQLVVLTVLARLLGPSDFGIAATGVVVVKFCFVFAQLGMGPAVVQNSNLTTKHIRVGFTLAVVSGLLIAALLIALAPSLEAFFGVPSLGPVIVVLACVIPIQSFALVAEALLQREMHFRELAAWDMVASVLGFGVVGLACAFVGLGFWSLVAANAAYVAGKSLLFVRACPHAKRPLWSLPEVRDLLSFGGGFTLARIGNSLAGQGDKMVVARGLGADLVGLYERAYQLMLAPPTLVGQVLDKVLFPTMARMQHDRSKLAGAYERGIALVALAVLPISAVLALLAPELIAVIFGPEWSSMIVPLQIFAVGMLFRTSYKVCDSVARATGAVYRRAWRQWVYAGAVVSFTWLGSSWGIGGAAVGMTVATTLNYLLMSHLAVGLTDASVRRLLYTHRPGAMLAIALGVVTWGVLILLRSADVSSLVSLGCVFVSLVLVGVVGIRMAPRLFLGEDGLWLLDQIRGMLPKSVARAFRVVNM